MSRRSPHSPLLHRAAWLFVLVSACASGFEEASRLPVRDSPHNLTQSGPVPSGRSVGRTNLADSDVCKSCHVAHGGMFTPLPRQASNRMLWSRAAAPVTYELYRSSTAKGVPTQPEGASRLCLSCHDGTIAQASTRMTPKAQNRNPLLVGSIVIPRHSLSRDLSDDHPIMVHQDAVARLDPQTKDSKTVDKCYRMSRSDVVHCTTCHDPHNNSLGAFLVADPVDGKMCTDCHQLRNWSQSIHATSAQKPASAEKANLHLQTISPRAETLGQHACLSCHRTHTAPTGERLLKDKPGRRTVCLNCHDGSFNSRTPSLMTEFSQPYAHDVIRLGGQHDALENLQTRGELLDGRRGKPLDRHVHCNDCHSAHEVASGTHEKGTSAVSPALTGATGVQVSYSGSPWTRPDWQYLQNGARFEYEICVKCHSYWSWGNFPPISSRRGRQTDVAVEFNPNNPSYHAVIGESRMGTRGEMVRPWKRDSRMYCSDCHGMPNGSKGPHGSSLPSMLRAPYNRENTDSGDLCSQCHSSGAYTRSGDTNSPRATAFANDAARLNLHVVHARHDSPISKTGIACIDCHVAVPHGWKRPALIAFKGDGEPYTDGAAIDDIRIFPSAGSWEKQSCDTACHGGASSSSSSRRKARSH